MQGERSSLDFLSETLSLEHGSTSSSNGVLDSWQNKHSVGDNDLQSYMLANSVSNNNTSQRFTHGEASSSSGTKNEASSRDNNEQRREPSRYPRNEIIDLDPEEFDEQPSQTLLQNVNLNAEYIEDNNNNNRSGFRVSQPNISMEESNNNNNNVILGGGGSSVGERLASRKRKALEGTSSIGQSSSSGGYHDFHHGESSSWIPASSSVFRPGNGLNLDHGSRGMVSSGTVPNFPSYQPETVNPSAFSAGTVVRRSLTPSQSNLQRHHLPAADQQHTWDLLRHGHTSSNVFSRNPSMNIPTQPPISRNILPPLQWSEVSLVGGGGSSNSVERNLHLNETRSRSVLENPMFIPPAPEFGNGNLNIAPQPADLPWSAYHHLPHYQRRRSELARTTRSLIANLAGESATNQRSGDHSTLASLVPPSASPPDGLLLQPGSGGSSSTITQIHNQAYARAGQWLDRQRESVVGVAATSLRRNRLMQMHSMLETMRRDPNLRFEEVLLLNQSVLAANMQDRYRDMRLDVDNMSYEELLALEERIGDVCTGLNEEIISNRLMQQKYRKSKRSPQDAEPCCVCQEEYNEGEDIGKLECGHEFHSQCIKEWLKQKNLCPICKTTGLNTSKKRKIG